MEKSFPLLAPIPQSFQGKAPGSRPEIFDRRIAQAQCDPDRKDLLIRVTIGSQNAFSAAG